MITAGLAAGLLIRKATACPVCVRPARDPRRHVEEYGDLGARILVVVPDGLPRASVRGRQQYVPVVTGADSLLRVVFGADRPHCGLQAGFLTSGT
jgi:hypothetical protein